MFRTLAAAAAAMIAFFAVPGSALADPTPVSINYTGNITGVNTTYSLPYDVPVQFTGFSTAEDFASGDVTITNFSAIYGSDVNNYGTGLATFNGSLLNIVAGLPGNLINITFNISPVQRSDTAFNTDYHATLSGFSTGAFGNATITGGSGTLRGFLPAVPEPATWAMMLLGFAVVGTAIRRQRPKTLLKFA